MQVDLQQIDFLANWFAENDTHLVMQINLPQIEFSHKLICQK